MRTCTIPSQSFLAIIDRELQAKGIKPMYIWNVYHNTLTRKKEAGILLHSFEDHLIPFDIKYKPYSGIIGFVNGGEPAEGTIPLHEVIPKAGDTIVLAYIIEGVYKGDFSGGKQVQGFHLIHSYRVQEKDGKEELYEISVMEMNSVLSE